MPRSDQHRVHRRVRNYRANTLLGFQFVVSTEVGVERGRGAADVVVPDPMGPINRNSGVSRCQFDVESPGIYEISMLSGNLQFARYTFEVRPRNP